ncbi:hypothetical protein HPP92_017485 [Vanilla planifolia]|uniref:Pentatricopeptide repeat-containing protein n=1 Tax=Vanilla planifolia TaxID=51239 RepID=A0A835UNH0_VANPL|nr:hypothetical protein HPP92_017485 [Vanilla planifolia]
MALQKVVVTHIIRSCKMRRCKLNLIPYKGKWHENFCELQAMENFKRKLAEIKDPGMDIFPILLSCFQRYEINPNPSAYSYVVKYVSQRRMFSQIPAILDHLEQNAKFDVPEKIFAGLIEEYGKANMLQDAVCIFYRILRFQCTPSALSLNSLLFHLCKKNEGLPLVQDVLVNSKAMNIRPETSTLHILLGALCRNEKVCSALELLKVMQLDEYTPNAKMYSMVLSLLCRRANASDLLSFLANMKNAGFLPTALEYNSVIEVLIKEGKVSHAYSLLVQMKSEGRRPDIFSYNSVLNGFSLANDFRQVEELFDEILVMGLLPNIFTFNYYINSLCEQGDLKKAHRMIFCMGKLGCKPNTETFNILLSGCVKAGEKEECIRIKIEMVEKGILWNSHTYSILIDGLLCDGETVEAYKLFQEMLNSGSTAQISTYNNLLCKLCEKDQLGEAIQVLEEMIRKALCPCSMAWETLLFQFKLGCHGVALDLEAIMLDH